MSLRNLTGAAVLAAVVSPFCLGGSAADKVSDNAKAFQAELEAMKGQSPRAILDKLQAWKFEPMSAWMTEDPASTDFKTKNRGKTKFTKKEIAEIFGQAGSYKIAVYGLLVGTESATMGEVDGMGRTVMKDASVSVQIYTAIRLVFRDEKLVSVRTWPKMERSAVTGGTRLIR